MSAIETLPRTIRELHDAYDSKKLNPSEVVQSYLSLSAKSTLNAYLTLCDQRAREQASRFNRILSQDGKVVRKERPLFGVPIAVKDVLNIDGVRTTCASKILENYVAPFTATAVARLEQAGAIVLGKTNMDEFAMGASNENSAFGPVGHPTHPGRVPGGSSGGSAAAQRAGLCLASLGTDTGGSIRLPASFCGVVGFKPTYGRVSRYGLVAFASSLDQIGPFANSVEDAARLLEVMAGSDPMDSTSAPVETGHWVQATRTPPNWKQLRIGVPKEYFVGGLDPDVEKAVKNSIEWMRSQGATIKEVSLPHTKYAIATYYLVAVSEASSNLARYDGIRFGPRPKEIGDAQDLVKFYQDVRSQFGPEVKRRIVLGTFALSSGYYDAYYRKACQVRALIRKDFIDAFEKVDAIVSPVAPMTAFKQGERSADPLKMYLVDIFTAPTSLAGLPAISLPCGDDREGLSVGLQIIGPHFSEDRIIQLAHAFETSGVTHGSK